MKRVGHLFEQVASFDSLHRAAQRTIKGHKSLPTYANFAFDMETHVLALERELLDGTYHPRPYRTFSITDPKPRTISAADLRDRVVHHAVCEALEPIFERLAIFDSYACRKGKGTHKALARVRQYCQKYPYFMKLDIRHFFETVDHGVLKAQVRKVVKDQKLLWLVDIFIDHGAPGSQVGKGLPIGNLTSQHFANFQLSFLDHFIKDKLGVKAYVRYMDDELLFADSKQQLFAWLKEIESFVLTDLKLELKSERTVVAPIEQGVPFLGFRVWPSITRLSAKTRKRFISGVRRLEIEFDQNIIDERTLVRSMASRVGHVMHANTRSFRRSVFYTD